MSLKKEQTLPILAILLLLISSITTLLVYAQTSHQEQLTILGENYSIDYLVGIGTQKTFQIDDTNYTGIHLSNLIKTIGVINPEQQYTITGSDGYQKTVSWENLENGIITQDKQAIFTDLPKAFRIKNIISIEVTKK